VFTGTPNPCDPLRDGDEIEIEVSGCGILRNRVTIDAGGDRSGLGS
jgi:2-keto-4-pentenoate hydratase/2-oxohepta-3-ene-1,7-dioic acid hydratase in catechol pathway